MIDYYLVGKYFTSTLIIYLLYNYCIIKYLLPGRTEYYLMLVYYEQRFYYFICYSTDIVIAIVKEMPE